MYGYPSRGSLPIGAADNVARGSTGNFIRLRQVFSRVAKIRLSHMARFPVMCRFLDAGMTNPSTRCGGRRPKSAKARNRGKWGTGGAAGLWRFFGTFRKCRSQCVMSAYRGRPEVIGEGLKRRD